MFKNFVFKLGLLTATLGSVSAAWAAEAGRVVFVTGEVQLAKGAAVMDAAVQEGDELTTGPAGYVYVKTIDGGFLILRPNSKARITTYHVDVANPANTRVKLELLSGVARSISGQAVKQARQNFRFNTPVAAIGVRGTDFIVYTDQQTSRVQVVSGGVVMSPFAGKCGPDGGGPCEGSSSRELFAGQPGALLQIQRGQRAPNLMHAPALAPDQNTPPRIDEPVGKVSPAASLAAPLPVVEVNLDAHKTITSKPPVSTTVVPPVTPVIPPPVVVPETPLTPTPPVVIVDPPPVTPPIVAPYAPEIAWGRHAAIAGLPADDAAVAKMENGSYAILETFTLGSYQLARLKANSFVMPKEGVGTYTLDGSDATLQNLQTGAAVLPAKVQDASLTVDYAARTFKTSLTLASATDTTEKLSSVGSLSAKGVLADNNPLLPNSVPLMVRGVISGAKAQEAAYVFKITTPKWEANGVTHWTK